MKLGKKGLATLGLVFITFLAAIQYVFLINVPESVSTFSFVCITNVIGMLILFATRMKRILTIKKKTLGKGAFFALLLTGFNVFILLGSRGMDSVAISSIVSLYFVFITPMLLLLRKKVNFFSGIATAMAIIALLLMFGGVADVSMKSTSILYLILADIFFAAYVVGVSILGEGEDNAALTFSQMAFAAVFSLIGWLVEVAAGNATFKLPTEWRFWVSALFIGIFIRAVYGLLQIACQKEVPPITTSLIFSMEIIITMIMDPLMSRILGTQHVPATLYQVIGAILLIIATLTVDDTIMSKLGYAEMNEHTVSKKMVVNTITFSMVTLAISTLISFYAIYLIRGSAVNSSTKLGVDASKISTSAMTSELERTTLRQTQDKTKLAEAKLATYSSSIDYAASYADSLFKKADDFPKHPADFAKMENAGKWAMQLTLANTSITYDDVLAENEILGNMEDIFAAIISENENVLTIYLGTENGLLISYDQFSQLVASEEDRYYEYRNSVWYKLGKSNKKSVFTDTYWDGYGRGLTITCVAPFFGPNGKFIGCVAMDVLMTDLNASMVNDGIVEPNVATLIDDEG
ncbi:MAG: EamA family transporter, partial [Lachnospiraceae bacterium]|nr:EamA family transporter [Lachnospiraceae bacterium]